MHSLLTTASPAVQLHVCAALLALILAPIQVLRRRRGRVHKLIGYIWVLAMLATAFSSFAIQDIRLIGPFSPIHGLSAYVIFGMFMSVRAARLGNITLHATMMRQTAFWGLGVAGAFTMLPGRLMNKVVWGQYENLGFAMTLAVLALAVIAVKVSQTRPSATSARSFAAPAPLSADISR